MADAVLWPKVGGIGTGLEFFDGLSDIFMIILCVAAFTCRHRSIRTRWQAPKRHFWLRMSKKIALPLLRDELRVLLRGQQWHQRNNQPVCPAIPLVIFMVTFVRWSLRLTRCSMIG